MPPQQRIIGSRRDYNRWVANETLEDYALRFTPRSARRWSILSVANTAFGGVSFLALEMIGGFAFLHYGFTNAVIALALSIFLIFFLSLPISYYSSKYNIDIDLLARGAGFGYIGSALTSLVYASFTFIFFAIEGMILAGMLNTCFHIPLSMGYALSALVVIPIVMNGFTLISRFQKWTTAIWLVLQLAPFVAMMWHSPGRFSEWVHTPFAPATALEPILAIGGAMSLIFSVITQIGEQADFLRFLPTPHTYRQHIGWWTAILVCGAGWIFPGGLKILAGMFLAWLVLGHGLSPADAQEPTTMYLLAFREVTSNPPLAMGLAAMFITLSQIRINITNAYAGSIAWSNFFSRMTHSHPGRIVWLVFNVGLALLLMEMDVYATFINILLIHSNIAASWIGALTADLVINKPLRISPPGIEFRRAYLYDINPVGVGGMTGGLILAALAWSGALGATAAAFSPLLGLAGAFILVPVIGYMTTGRYYLARNPMKLVPGQPILRTCVICQNTFEAEDMARCSVYAGFICSLCCTLDSRCHDHCKPSATRMPQQFAHIAHRILPQSVMSHISPVMALYICIIMILMAVSALVLGSLYWAIWQHSPAEAAQVKIIFWKVFLFLQLPQTVLAWFLALRHRSYLASEHENRYQTRLLRNEIRAHRRTDAMLKKAKDRAESANLSKSRFMVGVSHEIRTPLNSILGYAYLLEHRMLAPGRQQEGLKVIQRSAEHLSGLVEGLFDISKIEAGRLDILREKINLPEFLRHLTGMMEFQATQKGLSFICDIPENLPRYVYSDQRRLRQILINLLSNAIKFTKHGSVSFNIRWNLEIATFEIRDTGIGIPEEDRERILEPFQRGSMATASSIAGTGLGLTITQLLVQILGGDLKFTSKVGVGTTCRVRLMLSEALTDEKITPAVSMPAHHGSQKPRIFVVDDDPIHRGLVTDILEPLGFVIYTATNGAECLDTARHVPIDLFLLDIMMPGMNGWELAHKIRHDINPHAVILMVSANRISRVSSFHDRLCDGMLYKPVSIPEFVGKIELLLKSRKSAVPSSIRPMSSRKIQKKDIEELRRLAQIGYISGILKFLDQMETAPSSDIEILRKMAGHFDIQKLLSFLNTYETEA
ncbi:hybrid sensor histidine kinase/response regulator [Komagataeibacter sp. NFXK3]